MPPDVDAFRTAVGRFASGVTVLSARVNGLDHAMTASAFTSVSLEPLLVLVCVEQDARFHDALLEADGWGVSVLDDTARPIAAWLATRGRPLHGQLDRVPHVTGPLTGAPLVRAALATLECRTVATYPGGDHTIVVGEVLGLEVVGPIGRPLLWYRSAYAQLRE